MERGNDGFKGIEDNYAGYSVYDRDGDRIGKVDDLFIDENDQLEYVGVKMGFLGLKSTLIPVDVIRIDERRKAMEVPHDKSVVKDAPAFDADEEITPEFEQRVLRHFGLQGTGSGRRGSYDDHYGGDAARRSGKDLGDEMKTEPTDRTGGKSGGGSGVTMGDGGEGGRSREYGRDQESVRGRDGLGDEDEIRVQRSEEELRAGTREVEVGAMKIRKRVRTDHEQIRVPKRREEVSVERVPVNEPATGTEIGEDEIVVPVVEEEVIVDKRPVVKEEIRVRKDVVQDEEIVEADVRKEEVDIEDTTTRGTDRGTERGTGRDDERRRRRGR
jgi:uncharacterized protein (TIGR02271 family)